MRQRVIDRVEALGPCTVRELAMSLDVAPDSLYYHLRRLQKIGLVVLAPRRQPRSGRSEAVVRLRSRWHIAYELGRPANVDAVRAVGRTILRQAGRDFARGFEHPRAEPRGPLRNLWALRLEGSLRAADVRRINRHLAAILEVLRGAPRHPSAGLMSVSWVLAPLGARPEGRRGPERAGPGRSKEVEEKA
jgi:DNA-binding transcriptional ArsR family regulator